MTPIIVDPNEPGPLYLQIARRLRDAVAGGTLKPGTRLPSARVLATQLAVARGTVDAAYAMLAAEGAILSRRGSGGTVISPHFAAHIAPPVQPTMPFARPTGPAEPPLPFRLDLPALDAFPHKIWTNLTIRTARDLGAEAMDYPNPAGFPGLRQAIATYLGATRGVHCTTDQVIVTAGFQGALTLVRQVLLRPGDAVWTEDPGYPLARQALEAGGARIVPIRVDRDGMRIASARAAAPRARLAIVSPAQQRPLGVTLSLPRRLDLLAWATEAAAWILEDDCDGVFRYAGKPPPALVSLDRGGRVLYGGSFSKTLHPGLRLGYLVVPDELNGAFLRAARLLTGGPAALEQRVVAAFMQQGHFVRHLRRMRTLYAARRDALAQALTETIGDRFRIEREPGGLHLLARLPDTEDDTVLARQAQAAGLGATALSSLALAHDGGRGLLLGFTNITAGDAPTLASRLASALRGAG
jgi:GntR family transcriptional regulator/MocR family aminotransferase